MRQEELKLIFTAKKYLGEEWKQLKRKSDKLKESLTSDIAKKEAYDDRIRKYHARVRLQANGALSHVTPDSSPQEVTKKERYPAALRGKRLAETLYLGLGWDDPNLAKQLPASNGAEREETIKERVDKEADQNEETNRDDIAVVQRISLDLEAPRESSTSKSNEQHAR
ncbi:hypothetical protein BC827DRAFT_1271451 [Russula dissimulans]|nr:hypothetical protein BC827DRAFT_1271451 [Russula dissimulans]